MSDWIRREWLGADGSASVYSNVKEHGGDSLEVEFDLRDGSDTFTLYGSKYSAEDDDAEDVVRRLRRIADFATETADRADKAIRKFKEDKS